MNLDEIEQALEAATPGPWCWSNTQQPYLFGARTRVVMAFERMGMQGAQPAFNRDGILVPAGKENLYDFPDANLIPLLRNSAPEMIAEIRKLQHELIVTEISRGDIASERDRMAEAIVGSPEKAKRLASLVASSTRLVQIERDDARAERDRLRAAVEAVEKLAEEWDQAGAVSGPFPDRVVIDVDAEILDPLRATLAEHLGTGSES